MSRLKEQLEKLTEEKDKLHESEQRNAEANKRLSRQLRDGKDELADVQRHEAEAVQRKHDLVRKKLPFIIPRNMINDMCTLFLMVKVVLINKYFVLKLQENKVESLEADFEQSQSDLRLAFKRISDLQAVMEDEMDSDLDSEFDR